MYYARTRIVEICSPVKVIAFLLYRFTVNQCCRPANLHVYSRLMFCQQLAVFTQHEQRQDQMHVHAALWICLCHGSEAQVKLFAHTRRCLERHDTFDFLVSNNACIPQSTLVQRESGWLKLWRKTHGWDRTHNMWAQQSRRHFK